MPRVGRPRTCDCGECFKCKRAAYMREWYASKSFEERVAMREQRDMERVRRQDRERHRRMKGDPLYMKRRRAVSKVNNAIRDGSLVRGACEVCGKSRANAHHDDYDLPLDVRWFCTRHHAEHHAELAA